MITEGLYQDIIINGQTIVRGNRGCVTRWKSLLPFMARYEKYEPLKILDFGANYGYFSFKIAEQYPFSKVTMIDYEPLLKTLHQINSLPNTKLVFEYMDEERFLDYAEKNMHEYDLLLAMSVLHHFEHPEKIIDAMMDMAGTVIFEVGYPWETPVSNEPRVKPIHDYLMTKNPIQINNWIPHQRPLYYVNESETNLTGIVESGTNIASKKTFPEVNYQLWDLFRCKLYPGTLNIKLEEPVSFCNPTPFAEEYRIYPAYINGFPCYNIRPNHITYPTKNMELISPYRLRDIFNLNDGDTVNISMLGEYIYKGDS